MVKKERILKLTSHEYQAGPVVYWMNRDIRADDNWALLYAQELALLHKVPLIVLYNLAPGFLGGGVRQHVFKLQAFKSVSEDLTKKNIAFNIVVGDETQKDIVDFLTKHKVGALVTDFSPLHLPRKWVEYVRKHISIPMYGVDAHNIVPCWIASPKQEFGAYTLRPKLAKLLPDFLEPFPILKKHSYSLEKSLPAISWKKLESLDGLDVTVAPVDWITGDHAAAHKALKRFIANKLADYDAGRNDPTLDAQSNLSPYLHYGILGAQTIALAIGTRSEAFFEELVVRRELADNFCFYNPNYDTPEGFPEWAKKSHAKHAHDVREYLYTKKQFEHAKTHDELWNAAQQEMVKTGKMHGYMRMYWAKKILEWTKSPKEAMQIAIYLNDKYELDGRDPNGYAGIAWSIGGVHDRAWFERPVFGQIRYMNANGCKAKFDVQAYIAKWL